MEQEKDREKEKRAALSPGVRSPRGKEKDCCIY
jgi:hypothetical protein